MTKQSNRLNTFIVGILLLALTGFLAWCVVKVGLLFSDYISHSQPEVGAAIIAGSFTLLISVLSFPITRMVERNKELAQRRWEQEQELCKHIYQYIKN